jgi:hypothetical protein
LLINRSYEPADGEEEDQEPDADLEPGEGEDPDAEEDAPRRRKVKRGPVAAWDLVPRPPASVSLLWALGDDDTRRVIEDAHLVAVTEMLDAIVGVFAACGVLTSPRPPLLPAP